MNYVTLPPAVTLFNSNFYLIVLVVRCLLLIKVFWNILKQLIFSSSREPRRYSQTCHKTSFGKGGSSLKKKMKSHNTFIERKWVTGNKFLKPTQSKEQKLAWQLFLYWNKPRACGTPRRGFPYPQIVIVKDIHLI